LLSILSGHLRYAHIAALRSDGVKPSLLGMSKVVSDDTLRRALSELDETLAIAWLNEHLKYATTPLLTTPWILDTDVTVKPIYGKQEKALSWVTTRRNRGVLRMRTTPTKYRVGG
jgi:hypothetical protein